MSGDPLREALRDPSLYPGSPARVDVVETHISTVYLAGDVVLKVKKPLVLPFLDYGTLERRRFMCEEEVRLNRRLAPDLYLGVRALVEDPGPRGWRLEEDLDDPRAGEYAVLMRRFDEGHTLAALLEDGRARPEDVRALGRRLAAFHSSSPVPADAEHWPERLAGAIEENFDSLAALETNEIASEQLGAARRFSEASLAAWDSVLRSRCAAGCVRDGHGDLRAEHVIYEGRGPEAFDCAEFDSRLRHIDVGTDLAFLTMELAAAQRDDLAEELAGAYRDAGGDPGSDRLLAFFATYRAWVRVKVHTVRAAELEAEGADRRAQDGRAARLAGLARRLAWRSRGPQLLLICGPAASGKSWLASHLSFSGGLARLDSDQLRKQLLGVEEADRAPSSAYSERQNERTYRELGRRARDLLREGRGVAVAATFRLPADRAAFFLGLGDVEADRLFVECRAPLRVVRERARRRQLERTGASDAGPGLAVVQAKEFELRDVAQADLLQVDTDRPVEDITEEVEARLDRRLCDKGVAEKPQPHRGLSPTPGGTAGAKLWP